MTRQNALSTTMARLIARRDALRKALDDDLDRFGKVTEAFAVGDHVDAAVDAANEEICSRIVEIESRELAQIEHALERIASKDYGRCESCGAKIPAARLNAILHTTTCVKCQHDTEIHGRSEAPAPGSAHSAAVGGEPFAQAERDEAIDSGDFDTDWSRTGIRLLHQLLV